MFFDSSLKPYVELDARPFIGRHITPVNARAAANAEGLLAVTSSERILGNNDAVTQLAIKVNVASQSNQGCLTFRG